MRRYDEREYVFGSLGMREREMDAMVSALSQVVSGEFPSDSGGNMIKREEDHQQQFSGYNDTLLNNVDHRFPHHHQQQQALFFGSPGKFFF